MIKRFKYRAIRKLEYLRNKKQKGNIRKTAFFFKLKIDIYNLLHKINNNLY